MVLGAGGSARAACGRWPVRGPREVSIWNRRRERARALADELGATALDAAPPPPAADMLVNCTSVGLDGGDPFAALPLSADRLAGYGCVVDLVYTPSGTRLIDAAAQRGVARSTASRSSSARVR